ncbi:MAG: [protein-PII] uridylyltransferase [Acidimicrobiales bacterium]
MELAVSSFRNRRLAVIDNRDLQGRALCRALSDTTDVWLAELFEAVVQPGNTVGLALVAVGGYGRGELAPRSDLDLWLLHDKRSDVGEIAERLWYPIWDSGIKLGHCVQTPKQALQLVAEDLDTATASLSMRFLAGDESLVDGLPTQMKEQWKKRSKRWLSEMTDRTRARHENYDEVAFLLEPDIKEGRGGLRDIHTIRWIQDTRSVLHEGDENKLNIAEETFLTVRVALHRSRERAGDQLLLEVQDDLAKVLSLPNADALMALVSSSARSVAWISDESWARVESSLSGPTSMVFRRDQSLGPGLVLRDGEVHIETGIDIAADPSLIFRAATAAAHNKARFDRGSLERLVESQQVLDTRWPDEARMAFVDLLRTGHDAIRVLETLDQLRLLERILPEWAPVRSRPQRNAYHRFTVDRHLCETAANAAKLCDQVVRPDLLLIGAWLHDLGKGYPGDHTEVGMELMETVATRMGFAPEDVVVLVDMVRLHLLLPDVATRRDLADHAVINSVAETAGSLTTLELLAALTEADSLATGPSAWGSWKAELVSVLVDRAAHVLRGGEVGDVTAGGYPTDEIRALMADGNEVLKGSGTTLTVVCSDRPGLFSRVAGTMSLRGLTVLAADAYSADGMASSRFRVEPGIDPIDWDGVCGDLRRVLSGRLALEARLAERAKTYRSRSSAFSLTAPASVRVDNHASDGATVVEVHAPNRLGVLYRITRALADLDLDIRLAKVSTLGHEVVDTFYVCTTSGTKVEDRDHIKELERAILYQLSFS